LFITLFLPITQSKINISLKGGKTPQHTTTNFFLSGMTKYSNNSFCYSQHTRRKKPTISHDSHRFWQL